MMIEGLHSVTKLALGARHSMALCGFALSGGGGGGDDDEDDDDIYSDRPDKSQEELDEDQRNVGYWAPRRNGGGDDGGGSGGGNDDSLASVLRDPLEGPLRFVADENGRPTKRRVVPRSNEVFGWGE